MERPIAGNSSSQPNRSCQRCRKRKIRCDKGQPCSYCAKFGGQGCIYGDTPVSKSPIKDQDGRLEQIEQSLARLERYFVNAQANSQFVFRGAPPPSNAETADRQGQHTSHLANRPEPDLVQQRALNLNSPSIAPGDATFTVSGPNQSGSHHNGATGGAETSNIPLPHPDAERIQIHYHTYLESVHPILPILDPASVEQQLQSASSDFTNAPASFECLMFAIYCASVIALRFWASQDALPPKEWLVRLELYRKGFHLALTKADYLRKPDLVTLQALTLFLFCARTTGDREYVWAMTAVAVRHAMRLGLNRDTNGPDAPVRGALWHTILVLDALTSRDLGTPATINDDSYDARMPDSEQSEFLRYMCKMAVVSKTLILPLPFSRVRTTPSISSQERFRILLPVASELKLTYPMVDDDAAPYVLFMSYTSQILMTHLEILIHIPRDKTLTKVTFQHDALVDLLSRSLTALKLINTLRRDKRISRWSWAIDTDTDCDVVAFILSTLRVMKLPALVERIKSLLQQFFEFGETHTLTEPARWALLKGLRDEVDGLGFVDATQIPQIVDVEIERAVMSLPES